MSVTGLLFVVFFALCGCGIAVAALGSERRQPVLLGWVGSAAALTLLLASASAWTAEAPLRVTYWSLFPIGALTLQVDRLSAFFTFLGGIVFLAISIFSGAYLKKYIGHYTIKYFGFLYHLLVASIVFILISGDIFSFLFGWEVMSVVSYLLVSYENKREECARAGYLMLAMGEVGAILAALALILLAVAAHSVDFEAIRAASGAPSIGLAWAVFLLSFFGFSVKTGLVPFNSWLPDAHAVAPTNVHALLSGIIVKLGFYGIVRVNLDLLPAGAEAGLIVLVIGSISALVGVLYATIQTDMKRLLAHSTIEHMGIAITGFGAGLVFMAAGRPILAGIAFIASFYHLANHSLYKVLLLIGAGSIETVVGHRDLDRLGGLIRHMPWTSAIVLVGVVAIAALPPLNGFVSEWLTLQTILRAAELSSTEAKIVFALAGAVLALTAGLAVTCFVRAYAMGFLGIARTAEAAEAREAPSGMRAAMALLAVLCIGAGLLPTYIIPVLDRTASPFSHASAAAALVPPFFSPAAQRQEKIPPAFLAEFHDLGAQVGSELLPGRGLVVLHRGEARNPVVFAMSTSYMAVVLGLILAVSFAVFGVLTRGRILTRKAVWAGGLRRLTPGITYTATGFSNPVRVIFHAIVSPATIEDSTEAVAQHFRTAIRREQSEVHIVDRLVLHPPLRALGALAAIVRRMHVGHVNAYAAYVLVAMLIVLALGTGLR